MNNKGADQSERMRRLVCPFVVRKPPKAGFLASRPILFQLLDKLSGKKETERGSAFQNRETHCLCERLVRSALILHLRHSFIYIDRQ